MAKFITLHTEITKHRVLINTDKINKIEIVARTDGSVPCWINLDSGNGVMVEESLDEIKRLINE